MVQELVRREYGIGVRHHFGKYVVCSVCVDRENDEPNNAMWSPLLTLSNAMTLEATFRAIGIKDVCGNVADT